MTQIANIARMAVDAQRRLQQLATLERHARHGACPPLNPAVMRIVRDTERARLDICAEHLVQQAAANDCMPATAPELA